MRLVPTAARTATPLHLTYCLRQPAKLFITRIRGVSDVGRRIPFCAHVMHVVHQRPNTASYYALEVVARGRTRLCLLHPSHNNTVN